MSHVHMLSRHTWLVATLLDTAFLPWQKLLLDSTDLGCSRGSAESSPQRQAKKNVSRNEGHMGSNPGQGIKISHATWQPKKRKKKIYQSEGQRDNMREKYLPLIANGLSSLIYKELSQINKQKTKYPKEKQTKDMNRQFRNRNSHGPWTHDT